MNKNKIIIAILILIIMALVMGIALSMSDLGKKDDSVLNIKSGSELTRGESFSVKLTDVNGTPISNQIVNITITDNSGVTEYFSVVTSAKGYAILKIDKSAGDYIIECKFGGNDRFNGTDAVQKITVKNDVVQAEPESTSSSSSSDYDSGAFYSPQAGRTVYTGEEVAAPDGHTWRHMGNNEWERID